MRYETVLLTVPGAESPAELICYVPDNFPELGQQRQRTAVIICPGGRYEFLSDREGEPVALRFAGLGYAAFLLRYHTGSQGRYPIPQRQLLAAIDYVRSNCRQFHVKEDAVVVMGFSAGGHLAGCAGTMWNRQEIYKALKKPSAAFRPNGMVLCYPVITAGEFAHRASFANLLGEDWKSSDKNLSLEKLVRKDTPPSFLWHTADDTSVSVENTLLMQKALNAKGIRTECHIFPHGRHGQSLADRTVFPHDRMWQISVPCSAWVERCDLWLQRNFG